MAIYPPPDETLTIFNLDNYLPSAGSGGSSGSSSADIAYLDANYCKFPVCQGLLQTLPSSFVINNSNVNIASSVYTNSLLGKVVGSSVNIFNTKTISTNDFNFGTSATAGQTININNNLATSQISSFQVIDNNLNPIVNTDSIQIGNAQSTGVLNIATAASRTADINIGTGTLGKYIDIGGTTSAITNLGDTGLVKINGLGVSPYAFTLTASYSIPTDFPNEGLIYSPNSSINITFNSNGPNGRSFVIVNIGSNNFFVLPAGYVLGGLLKNYAYPNILLTRFSSYTFRIDETTLTAILVDATNSLSTGLNIGSITDYTPITQRGKLAFTASPAAIVRAGNGNVGFAYTPNALLGWTLPVKGVYFIRMSLSNLITLTTGSLRLIGMGVFPTSASPNADYSNGYNWLTIYQDYSGVSFRNSTTPLSRVLCGYYVYNDSTPATIFPNITVGYTNSGGSSSSGTIRMDVWLVG